ncbi:hypothetical protein BE17_36660 [Sorangium cellulosum]|uniref:Uncharacterized protein n=1 Tax=Sorangium cellulosum TaxID=56 RepID=A0A150R0H1_SORCE|nr:hypothetical protein BE17_36660 [Sorangium cellulosum]
MLPLVDKAYREALVVQIHEDRVGVVPAGTGEDGGHAAGSQIFAACSPWSGEPGAGPAGPSIEQQGHRDGRECALEMGEGLSGG